MQVIDLVLPGDPATRTGGYIYDRRILAELAALGWETHVHRLDDSFPLPTPAAVDAAADTLARIPAGRSVVLDGLALPELAETLRRNAARLRLIALVHHPAALETGLPPDVRARVGTAERASLAVVRGTIVTSRWTARTLAEDGVPSARIRVVEPGTDPVTVGAAEVARGIKVTGAAGAVEAVEVVGAVRMAGAAEAAGTKAESPDPRDGRGAEAVQPGTGRERAREARPYRLLCVGTLTPRKGHALLIEALAALHDRSWVLDCVGSTDRDPATATAIRRLIAAHGLERRVRLRGELGAEAVARCYAEADAFVLASELEGYGMALAEAVAHGLPIVSTTAGAIPDTAPAAGSLLVPPRDGEALRVALARLLDDPDVRRRLEAGAREARASLPSWPMAGARFAAALVELSELAT